MCKNLCTKHTKCWEGKIKIIYVNEHTYFVHGLKDKWMETYSIFIDIIYIHRYIYIMGIRWHSSANWSIGLIKSLYISRKLAFVLEPGKPT